MSTGTPQRQDHRHSNSFTREAVAAFQAVSRTLMRDPRYLAYMRNAGWQELCAKFQKMANRDAERKETTA